MASYSGEKFVNDEKFSVGRFFDEGINAATSGNFDHAIRCFTDAININQMDHLCFLGRSLCYKQLGLYSQALRDIERSVVIDRANQEVDNLKWADLTKYVESKDNFSKIKPLINMGRNSDGVFGGCYELETPTKSSFQSSDLSPSSSPDLHIEDKLDHTPECRFYRTTGCKFDDACIYKHIPEHEGINLENSMGHVTLSVGPISSWATDRYLEQLFKGEGQVIGIKRHMDRGTALVTYSSKNEAKRALETLQGKIFFMNKLHLKLADNPTAIDPAPTRQGECLFYRSIGCKNGDLCKFRHIDGNEDLFTIVWVGYINPDVTDEELYQLFKKHGQVINVNRLRQKWCAFVTYTNDSAPRAMENLDGQVVGGWRIFVYKKDVHVC